jgi:hypothetical protein
MSGSPLDSTGSFPGTGVGDGKLEIGWNILVMQMVNQKMERSPSLHSMEMQMDRIPFKGPPRTPSNGAMMLCGIGPGIALPTLA